MRSLLIRIAFTVLDRLLMRLPDSRLPQPLHRLHRRLYVADLRRIDMVRYRVEHARDLGATVGPGCQFYSLHMYSEPYLIEIGKNVMISGQVVFITHDGGMATLRDEIRDLAGHGNYGRIKIGDNCFIGLGAIILPNVQIGNNCVVAAGAVVFDSFPDDCVIMGNPARVAFSHEMYGEMKKNSPLTISDPAYPFPGAYPREILLERIGHVPIRKPRRQ